MHLPPRSALSACMERIKHTITMTCSDAVGPSSKYLRAEKDTQGPTWEVVHHVKADGSGIGLSGGWRGFSLDNVSHGPCPVACS